MDGQFGLQSLATRQPDVSMTRWRSSAGAVAVIVAAVIVLLLSSASGALAVPAQPGEFTVIQPDGSELILVQWGDEFAHGVETLEGYTVVLNEESGFWEYAEVDDVGELVATGLIPGQDDPAGLLPHVRPTGKSLLELANTLFSFSAPTTPAPWEDGMTGSQPSLVLLLSFTNQGPSTTAASWADRYFGPSNSVRDFYDTASFGLLDLSPATEFHGVVNDGIVGWINVGVPHPNGNPTESQVRDFIQAADPYVNFSSFDTDGNGALSADELHISMIWAGSEQAFANNCSPAVWAHAWRIGTTGLAPVVDGVRVAAEVDWGRYNIFGEMHCRTTSPPGSQATMGIMAHEMGHTLGLPDLYDTPGSTATSEGVGDWSVMGGGSWNGPGGDGSVPALPDAWTKWYMGWLTPDVVSGSEYDVDVPTAATSPTAVQLLGNPGGVDWVFRGGSGTGEYFLVENRQHVGYDEYLPGCGLLVWHIDESVSDQNDANSNEDGPRLVDLVDADGAFHLDEGVNQGDAGDPYPGTSNVLVLNGTTTPSTRSYSGTGTGAAMQLNAQSCSSTMTADFSTNDFDATTAVANDDLANAPFFWFADTPELFTTSTVGATIQSGETTVPTSCAFSGSGAIGSTIWYRVDANISWSDFNVDTIGSDFDTVLAVYEGPDDAGFADLVEVACNDDIDYPDVRTSRVVFDMTAGMSYFLQVGGYDNDTITPATGQLAITIGGLPHCDDPLVDSFCGPFSTPPTLNVRNIGATTQDDEPIQPSSCSLGTASIGRTVWRSIKPDWTGPLVVATDKATYDTVLAIYAGTPMTGLTPIACNDDISSDSRTSSVLIDAVAGQEYWVQIGGWTASGGAPAQGGGSGFWNPQADHDAFVDARTVTLGQTVDAERLGATLEPNEPQPSCSPVGATVWHRVTVAEEMTIRVTLDENLLTDPVLTIYTGAALGGLTEVACAALGPEGTEGERRVSIEATPGQVYWIQASGVHGAMGNGTLTVEREPFDTGGIRVLGGTGVISAAVFNHLDSCTNGTIQRHSGVDRYATAAEVSKVMRPFGGSAAFIATGGNFPDAAAAGSAAVLADAPILLTQPNAIPSSTAAELSRLGVDDIVILGGTGAVSSVVGTALGAYGDVARLSGSNRYATAASVSQFGDPWSGLGRVYVATGDNFPDALTGSVAAAVSGSPVLLVTRDAIPTDTAAELARLNPKEIVILGGTGVISDSTAAALGTYASTVRRLAGATRYGTAAAISADTFPSGSSVVWIATGENYPDALVGGAAAGKLGQPLLLVSENSVPAETAAEISRLTGTPCAAFTASNSAAQDPKDQHQDVTPSPPAAVPKDSAASLPPIQYATLRTTAVLRLGRRNSVKPRRLGRQDPTIKNSSMSPVRTSRTRPVLRPVLKSLTRESDPKE